MKFLFAAIIATIFSLKAFSTAQYPDKILFNGKEYDLHSNPLESYFEQNPSKRPKGGIESTALWRGYVATFEVKDSVLVLKDIRIEVWDTTKKKKHEIKWKSVMADVFPETKDVRVYWLTGLLVLPYGKLINYVHMGYGSTYENYILIEIDKGEFKKVKELNYKDYEEFKDLQFQAFKQTDEYQKTKADLQKGGNSDEFIENFLRNFIIQYTSRILAE